VDLGIIGKRLTIKKKVPIL